MATIEEMIQCFEKRIEEMTVKTEFEFKEIRLDYKSQELYRRVLVDNIAPYYFAVIRESKYADGLDNLTDNYRASIEYQSFAYEVKDYRINKADALTGIVRNFSDLKQATRWLKDKVRDNFVFTLKEQEND